jgi:hypothetical protein
MQSLVSETTLAFCAAILRSARLRAVRCPKVVAVLDDLTAILFVLKLLLI